MVCRQSACACIRIRRVVCLISMPDSVCCMLCMCGCLACYRGDMDVLCTRAIIKHNTRQQQEPWLWEGVEPAVARADTKLLAWSIILNSWSML